jgi:hypothetical protein
LQLSTLPSSSSKLVIAFLTSLFKSAMHSSTLPNFGSIP